MPCLPRLANPIPNVHVRYVVYETMLLAAVILSTIDRLSGPANNTLNSCDQKCYDQRQGVIAHPEFNRNTRTQHTHVNTRKHGHHALSHTHTRSCASASPYSRITPASIPACTTALPQAPERRARVGETKQPAAPSRKRRRCRMH